MIKLAIWYLNKRKVSVLLNMKIEGGIVQQTTYHGCTYNNTLNDIKYLDKNGNELVLPEGKFRFEYPDY